jgi:hypothetical protein
MICDDCIKKDVCKYAEKCKAYEEEYASLAEDPIAIEVKCKHKEAKAQQLFRRPPEFPALPIKEPTDNGKVWTSPNTGSRPIVRYDDETGCVPR